MKSKPNKQQIEYIKANLYKPNRELITHLNKIGDKFSICLLVLCKRRLRTQYSQDVINNVLDLYEQGNSYTKIASLLKIHLKDITSIVMRNKKNDTQYNLEFCRQNYKEMTAPQMAKHLKVPLTTIANILHKNKLFKRKQLTDLEIEYIKKSLKEGKSIKKISVELGIKSLYYTLSKFKVLI